MWQNVDKYMEAVIEDLKGVVLKSVVRAEDNSEVTFTAEDGRIWKMLHFDDCCECVLVDDVVGALGDLVGTPILLAEEVSSEDTPAKDEYDESYTWTFYKLATAKGYVTIRWYGSSNGYYSESVDFVLCKED